MGAHEDHHVNAYLAALDPVFADVAQSVARGDVLTRIDGKVSQAGFARPA